MKTENNLKIEIKVEDSFIDNLNIKQCFWRIQPAELSWWRKLFNPWKRVYCLLPLSHEKISVFSKYEVAELVRRCKTVGDIKQREAEIERISQGREI